MLVFLVAFFFCTNLFADGLTHDDAKWRASVVKDVKYDLTIHLSEKDEYWGHVTGSFELLQESNKLFVDFKDGYLRRLKMDDEDITINYDKKRIIFGENLKAGRHIFHAVFSHKYSQDGSGLYKFFDEEDKSTYVYTDFEPFEANRLFPHFDQPDIKANYKMTVTAPQSWQVITYDIETKIDKVNESKIWTFPESATFSSYLFSLHAGPYKVWSDKTAKIPSRLFARQTLAKYVKTDEWFTITRQGFAYYEEYFATPYPFQKYDQVIVPDFNSGAMENVAAVTFSEDYVSRGTETLTQREDRADVVLHEMAHMWFGNLVTMKWWDDLWLNESFATYMAAKAMYTATEFKEAWRLFYQGMKQWAYWEDQLVTTHPIVGNVNNTTEAFTNFDGITYGKGASFLKQLEYYLGEKVLQEGIQIYFKKHRFQNAELSDFITALSHAAKKDLNTIKDSWLTKAGLNTIRADYTCENGKISNFLLKQFFPKDHPYLRPHQTEIALIYSDKSETNSLAVKKTKKIFYSDLQNEIMDFINEPCPDVVYPNYGDFDYVKIELDDHSLENLSGQLRYVKDLSLRAMLWQSLWDLTEDGKLGAEKFGELVLLHLKDEEDDKILENILAKVFGKYNTSKPLVYYLPKDAEFDEIRARWSQDLENFAKTIFEKSLKVKKRANLIFPYYIKSIESPNGLKMVLSLLNSHNSHSKQKNALQVKEWSQFEIDQDKRWLMIHQLAKKNYKNIASIIKNEKKLDPSHSGKQQAIMAESLIPDKKIKNKFLSQILNPNSKISLSDLKQSMYSFFVPEQVDLTKVFAKEIFLSLDKIIANQDVSFISAFAENMLPYFCSEESHKQLTDASKKFKEKNFIIYRNLRVALQENDRCQNVRKTTQLSLTGKFNKQIQKL